MSLDKRAIRQALRERRACLAATAVEAAGTAVCGRLQHFAPYDAARSVLAYVAVDNEIPLMGLFADVAASGRQLYLPRSTVPPAFAPWRPGDPLVTGGGGFPEPSTDVAGCIEGPAVALVPLLGWDEAGTRLGRGGGFYDRFFADGAPAEMVRVGVAYEFQHCANLPRDPWDVALHYVITERRIVRCGDGLVQPASLQKGGLHV